MASNSEGSGLEKALVQKLEIEKEALPKGIQLVQTDTCFDWVNNSGRYVNTLSDKALKINHTYFDNNVNLERVDAVTLGRLTPTCETFGTLFFEPEDLEVALYEERARDSKNAYLTLGGAIKIKIEGAVIPLEGYYLSSSQIFKTFGVWNDEDVDKQSTSLYLADKNSGQSIKLVYVENVIEGAPTAASMNIARDGRLFPIDMRENRELSKLFLTVNAMHLRLRQNEVVLLDYTDLTEKSETPNHPYVDR